MSSYNLKIWRILACVGVWTTHVAIRIDLKDSMLDLSYLVGYFGLAVFYAISGYLVCYSPELRSGNVIRYWIKRAISILPLYYFVIGIYYILETYVFQAVPVDKTGFGWKRYIFLFFDLVHTDEKFWRDLGFTWTIQIFLVFYLLAPLIYKLVDKYWKAWIAVLFFFVLSIIINKYMNGNLHALTYMHYCLMGFVLYFAQKEGKQKVTIFISVLLVLFFYTVVSKEDPLIELNNNLYALLFMVLFLVTERVKISSEIVKNVIDTLEPYTFTFYLMQGMVWDEVVSRKVCSFVEVMIWMTFGIGVLTVIVYHVYEKPMKNFLKKILLNKNQGNSR